MSHHGRGWQEVGDRVFRFRYRSLDLNVGAVLGTDEVLVVDTRSLPAEAAELLDDLRRLTRLPCRQVVNTHAHFDHCFGNATLRPAAIWGHQRCAAHLRARADQERAHLRRWLPEAAGELQGLVLDPPDRTVGDAGGRPGRGRAAGRAALLRPRPHRPRPGGGRARRRGGVRWRPGRGGAPPVYGADAFPLEWPATLERLAALAPPVLVPGHGDVVGHRFVAGQREELAAMAGLCRRVAAGELGAAEAVAAAPFPEATARDALALAGRVSS